MQDIFFLNGGKFSPPPQIKELCPCLATTNRSFERKNPQTLDFDNDIFRYLKKYITRILWCILYVQLLFIVNFILGTALFVPKLLLA